MFGNRWCKQWILNESMSTSQFSIFCCLFSIIVQNRISVFCYNVNFLVFGSYRLMASEEELSSEDSSTSDEEIMEEDAGESEEAENFLSSAMVEEKERVDAARDRNISRILDFTFTPRKIEKDGKKFVLRMSRKPANRDEIIELSKSFQKVLEERQVRMQGFCPIRRELYDLLFDELIRQSTINCPERGSLLLRARDEFKMTMAASEKLYESGVVFGTRKALEAEIETRDIEIQHKQLQEEVARVQKRIQDLRAEIDAEEEQSKQKINMQQHGHEEKKDFLKKVNKQLMDQIKYISSSEN